MKTGSITFAGEDPLEISNIVDQEFEEPTDEQRSWTDQIGKSVKEYLVAVVDLLDNKYSHLSSSAPVHLSSPGKVLAVVCPDGVVIRYEKRRDGSEEKMRIFNAWMPKPLSEVATLLSQGFVHCHDSQDYTSTIPETGQKVVLSTRNRNTQVEQTMAEIRVGYDVVVEFPETEAPPAAKPFCLASVRNELNVNVSGVLLSEEQESLDEGHLFVGRGQLRVPLGWECIEVYPSLEMDRWNSDYAGGWAERDLLAAIAQRQFVEREFSSLDPGASARLGAYELLDRYEALLDSNPEREEVLQQFLKDNPFLLCQIHTRMWPKLGLGNKQTDFVFQLANRDYLLVELEPSTDRLFIKSEHMSARLRDACGQITDWKRYIEDNLQTVRNELGLAGISSSPQSLVVIGRSDTLTDGNRRKLQTMANETPTREILTYDDVYENAKAVFENLFGPRMETRGSVQIYYPQAPTQELDTREEE